jgi:hypothetical protein
MDLKWEEPHATKRGPKSSKWALIFDELRKHPGAWALVAENISASMMTTIKKGQIGGAAPGEFEASSRKTSGSRADIYARYVGGESA